MRIQFMSATKLLILKSNQFHTKRIFFRLVEEKYSVLPEFSEESHRISLQERLGWFWWQCLNSRHLVQLELISLWRQTGKVGYTAESSCSSFCLLFIHAFTNSSSTKVSNALLVMSILCEIGTPSHSPHFRATEGASKSLLAIFWYWQKFLNRKVFNHRKVKRFWVKV